MKEDEPAPILFFASHRAPQACRRQAPAWLVSALFSTYPESAYETTQFGELPLHLAVESGAAPEVVNLIMVANWSAIVIPDNSGRIPTEILDRGELLLLDEHRIVHESLSRCYQAYTDMQKAAQDEQAELARTHKREMAVVQRQHAEGLKQERGKQENIRQEVVDLQAEIENLKRAGEIKDCLVEETRNETKIWEEKACALSAVIEQLRDELAKEKAQVMLLAKQVESKEHQISSRDGKIEVLSNDIRSISMMHEHDMMESVRATERTMRSMVSSQIALQKQFAGQGSRIRALLNARGIDLSEIRRTPKQEEKENSDDEPLDQKEAATALASAAMAALNPNV